MAPTPGSRPAGKVNAGVGLQDGKVSNPYGGETVQKAVWAAFEEAGLFEKASSEGKKLQQRAGLQATRGKIDIDAMSSSEKADFNNKADANMKEANKRDPGLMYSAPQNVTSKDNRRYRAEIAAAGKERRGEGLDG